MARERHRECDRAEDAGDDQPDAGGVVQEQLDVVVSDERPADRARRRSEEQQPDQREDPPTRDERAHRSQRSHERCDFRELDVLHAGRTLRHE